MQRGFKSEMETLKIGAIIERVEQGRRAEKKRGKKVGGKQLLVGFPFIPVITASRCLSISNYSMTTLH